MINIYNLDGEIIMQAPITKEAQREEELSKSDFISLSFSAACKIILPVGAYIVHTYYIDQTRKVTQRFSLLEPYEPVQTDEMSWKYTPEFQHPKMLLGKIPFYIKTKNSQNEAIKQTNWTFVGTPDVIMGKICDFLNNDIQFGKCGWKSVLSGELKNSLSVSFSDNDVLSALSSIANAEGDTCEWHIDYDNEDIYLGKVILDNTPISLEVGKNIGTPSVTESKENYYNSYTVFGGTRNITQTNSLGENVSSSDIRLQLASGKGIVNINGKEIEYTVDDFSTIDLRKDKTKEPLLTKVLNFSDVFPSLNTYVYKVRGRKKYVLDDTTKKKIPLTYNADGSVAAYKIFTVWYMRLAYCTTTEDKTKKLVNKTVDNGVTHYWYDFELTDNLIVNGKTLSCSFEANTNINALSTPLAGRGTNGEHVGFELKYHKDNYSAHDSDDVDSANFNILSGDYEIIYQEDNNLIIPTNEDERLIPRGESLPSLSCNITVLYNIAMSEQYQKDAQEKLLDKAIKEIERLNSDLNNYEFSVYPQVFEANNPRLQIGQKVKYSDGQGYTLDTRILKLTTNLNYDFIQEITVGNQANKGTVTQLKDDVQTIIANSSNGNGSSYSGSQFNSIVSKYGGKHFLSKLHDDIAQGIIRFMQGLKLGDGDKGIDAKGNAVLGDAVLSDVVVDRVHDAKSTPAERVPVGAQGFDLYMGEDGKSHLYIDYLTTRVKMFAASAEVRKVSYSGGTTIFSNAGSTIVKVAYIFDASGSKVIAYKCYAAADDGTTRTMNWWHVGMMALCQTFNVKEQRDGEALANRYYWRLVVGVGQEVLSDGKLYDYVILSNVKEFSGSDGVPCYGIKLLADGQNNVLSWGGVAVSVVSDNGMSSFASVFNGIEGGTQDDGEKDISSRLFYGYEPAEGGGEPDAPSPNDVIVQVGDQVRWKKYGNLIKLTTSTEDNATDNAPAIAMYHSMGAPYVDKKSGNTNPYQWKTLTSLDSPELVLKNAKNFQFFTNDDPKDRVSPISTTYEIIASSDTLVRNPMTQTVTPADITFSTVKRYGSKTETETTISYQAKYTTQDDVTHEGPFVSALSELEVNLYDIKEITVFAHESINTVLTSRTIAVLTDGEKGDKGDKGADTLSLVATPSTLVFGTDDKGKAQGQAVVQVHFSVGSSIKIFMNAPVFKTENFEDGYTPTRQGEEIVIIDASKIKAQKIVDTADGTERYVSCTSASVTIADTLNGKQYQVKIPIFVDVESYISRMEMTAKQYKQTFEELKLDLGQDNPEILTKFKSVISQRADGIALEVKKTNEGLQQAGIYLGSGEIKMKAEKTKFIDSKGNEVAVFNADGLNADLINAKHVWAKSEDGNSTVGYFGNYDIQDCNVGGNVYAPLFIGSSTAKNAPFYVDSTGAMKATAGEIANFVITSSGLRSGIKGTTDYLYLGDFQVAFVSRDSRDKVRLGSSVLTPSTGYAQSGLYIESTHDFENYESIQVNIGSYIEVGGKQYLPAVRTLPDDDETQYINGNHALYIQKGDVVGLRPMLTVAKESRNILKRECVIMCIPPQNTTIILTLPDDPEVGQHYTIINKTGHWKNGANGGTVRIQSREGKGKSIFRFSAENSWSFDIWQIYTVTEIWFDGDNWIMQYYAQY